ncbi:hypothetical protein BpJC7_26360 [Weizmannia acidilactici]|uniref:Activator of Hsp90 ATPase homologue 1/2-like C-terminal domain-containing protein n=1 Tax=Weizmannia acidilactici TaxID=2607726 RepID=A0A5J4JGW3_9BACI|nr:SRPBCC domain-containing protein [Weizmannia acidilactici]GER68289.1 hypothetical protein BpJC4_27600 [Weizmannia acidilactici]GER71333.1 hypothetical protein BpJC7_26360 [Weizmannia acidilactici]GER72559.1 hypothetical protein BpPP18_06260 [Weizmannia acidilactici]
MEDIIVTATLPAPIEQVWETVSTPEGLSAWFMPNNLKAEPGYEFSLQSPFGPSTCKVLEADPPRFLSFAWDEDGWFLPIALKGADDQTEFTLTHGGWKEPDHIIEKAREKTSVIRARMEQGWMNIVNTRLKKLFV